MARSLSVGFLPVRNILQEGKTQENCMTAFRMQIVQYLNLFYVFYILFVRKLEHPHIVKFYGTSLLKKEGTTRVILVMEKCKGNLKNEMFGRPESAPSKTRNPAVFIAVFQWVKEITDALAFIHKQGVVHRDLKLENILVCFVCYDNLNILT